MSTIGLTLLLTLTQPAAEAPRPEPVTLVGQVRTAAAGPGGKARILLVNKDAEAMELHTPRREDRVELERLAGVKVRVRGHTGDPRLPGGRHVMVDDYRILDVGGGAVPEVGRLAALEVDGAERLLFVSRDGQAALLPEGWARKMKRHVGAKVWMLGERDGGRMTPKRFAILRAAERGVR